MDVQISFQVEGVRRTIGKLRLISSNKAEEMLLAVLLEKKECSLIRAVNGPDGWELSFEEAGLTDGKVPPKLERLV